MMRPLFVPRATVIGMLVLPLFSSAQVTNSVTSHPAARASDTYCATQAPATGASLFPGEIHIKILLVEFSDVHCARSDDGQTPRYTARDFENLLGSEGTYVSPRMFSPDGDEVQGSMNDYFRAMSGGSLRLRASVVNRLDPDGRTPSGYGWRRQKHTITAIPGSVAPFSRKQNRPPPIPALTYPRPSTRGW